LSWENEGELERYSINGSAIMSERRARFRAVPRGRLSVREKSGREMERIENDRITERTPKA